MKELLEAIKNRASNPNTIHDMALGLNPAPKIKPIVSLGGIEEAQKELGFNLPELLKNIYTQIGNGGFGPGYGLNDLSMSVTLYFEQLENNEIKKAFFPLCTWGCGIDSYVDCKDENYPVYFKSESGHCLNNISFTLTDEDGNLIESGKNVNFSEIIGDSHSENSERNGLILHKNSLEEWFSDWIKGVNMWDEMESKMN